MSGKKELLNDREHNILIANTSDTGEIKEILKTVATAGYGCIKSDEEKFFHPGVHPKKENLFFDAV